MGVYELGRVAYKLLGREAGYACVVVDIIDKNYVLVEGLKVRRRRANVNHLAPTKDKIELARGADSKAVQKAVKAAKMDKKFAERIALDL